MARGTEQKTVKIESDAAEETDPYIAADEEEGSSEEDSDDDCLARYNKRARTSTDDELEEQERICASHAIRDYGVRREDLNMLDCEMHRNPHYRSAAPMRLYLRTDIIKLAKATDKLKAIEKEIEKAARQEAAEKRKEEAKKHAAMAKKIVAEFEPFDNTPQDSGLSIAWPIIVPRLVTNLCQDMPKVKHDTVKDVMHKLEELSLTCREMRQLITQLALPALAERVHSSELGIPGTSLVQEDGKLPPLFDNVLQSPATCMAKELQAAAKLLRISSGGTKEVLILRLLAFFGIEDNRPRQVPAAIAFAMRDMWKVIRKRREMRHPLDKLTSRQAAEEHWQRIQQASAAMM